MHRCSRSVQLIDSLAHLNRVGGQIDATPFNSRNLIRLTDRLARFRNSSGLQVVVEPQCRSIDPLIVQCMNEVDIAFLAKPDEFLAETLSVDGAVSSTGGWKGPAP